MEQRMDEDNRLIRYLLGDLPEAEKDQLERQFLSDDTCFERLLAIEEDLIEAYVRDELSPSARAQFERYFMKSSWQRARVESAKSLLRAIAEEAAADASSPVADRPAPVAETSDFTATHPGRASGWASWAAWWRAQKPAPKLALAATALVVALGGPWLIVKTRGLRTQLAQLQTERRQLQQQAQAWQQQAAERDVRSRQLAAELQSERNQRARLEQELARRRRWAPSSIDLFELAPGFPRDPGVLRELPLPTGTRPLWIKLYLEGEYPYKSYRAALTLDGREIGSQDMLPAQSDASGQAVVLSLAPGLLSSGECTIKLWGVIAPGKIKEVGVYYFRVVTK